METTVVKLRSNAVKIQGCNTTTTDDSCCNATPSPRPPPPTQRENNLVISLADVDIVEVSETGRRFSCHPSPLIEVAKIVQTVSPLVLFY